MVSMRKRWSALFLSVILLLAFSINTYAGYINNQNNNKRTDYIYLDNRVDVYTTSAFGSGTPNVHVGKKFASGDITLVFDDLTGDDDFTVRLKTVSDTVVNLKPDRRYKITCRNPIDSNPWIIVYTNRVSVLAW